MTGMAIDPASAMTLSCRDLAMLRAVASGNAVLTSSCEPDLFIDGLAVCDQSAVHRLVHLGLLTHAHLAPAGERVAARLTALGVDVLRTNNTSMGTRKPA